MRFIDCTKITDGWITGSWGSDPYGQSFGLEGDGVELRYRARQAEARDRYDLWQFAVDFLDRAQGIPLPGSFEGIQWPQWAFDDKPESNAKPALPALTRQAGEKYKGLGFCDGMDQ